MSDRLRESFPTFLRLIWEHLSLPPPDPIQIDIAKTLQYGPNRQVIQAFRGAGKSYITGAFCCWCLLRDPDETILVLSASQDKASDQSQFMLRLITDVPVLQHLTPRDNQRSSMLAFDVNGARVKQSPSVRSRGITSTITGGRATIIVADDIETPDNSMTQVMRDKIREKVKELDNIITPGRKARIIYLGTPQLEDTLYEILPRRGYKAQIWPVQFPSAKEIANYGDKLAPALLEALQKDPDLTGKPLEPRRFGQVVIDEKKITQGAAGFALQYMLDPTLTDVDRYPLKLRDLVVMDVNPELGPEKVVWASSKDLALGELPCVGLKGDRFYSPLGYNGRIRDADGRAVWQPYTGALLAIDPSGRGEDETGYAVTKFLNSQIFVTDAGGFKGGHEEKTLQRLAAIAKQHQVKHVIVEANFGDGMWAKLFTPYLVNIGYPVTIEEVKASNTMFKEARILDVLEPVMAQHRLIVDKKVIEQDHQPIDGIPPEKALRYQLFYQMTRLTRVKRSLMHDDRLDALAWAVWYWAQQMAGDQEARMQATQEAWMQRQIDDFMFHCLGHKPQPLTWM